jgi:hypothetical protein
LLLATSQLAVSLVNWLASLLVAPHPLPKLDFSEGIPPASRTLVVVPTMLTSAAGIDSLIEALEVRFLANRDPNLHFALLTDFFDAGQETQPEDAALMQLAAEKIDDLNFKFGQNFRLTVGEAAQPPAGSIFFLFHRPRRWNPQERVWMGYERKRGKLADLNALLMNGTRDGFSLIAGDTTALAGTRYVITLDTDTQLPRDTARQFVGTMSHPLNRPSFDETQQRVVSGYGILQPRVAVSLPGTNRSLLARLYGGEPGIDPYTRAVSDVYQDVFGEGSFIGKGIYDVAAFERALGGCFRKTASSATTCSKAAMPGPACSATCSSMKTARPATGPMSSAATAGCVATGNWPAGCSTRCRVKACAGIAIRYRICRNGSSSTICGAVWSRLP